MGAALVAPAGAAVSEMTGFGASVALAVADGLSVAEEEAVAVDEADVEVTVSVEVCTTVTTDTEADAVSVEGAEDDADVEVGVGALEASHPVGWTVTVLMLVDTTVTVTIPFVPATTVGVTTGMEDSLASEAAEVAGTEVTLALAGVVPVGVAGMGVMMAMVPEVVADAEAGRVASVEMRI